MNDGIIPASHDARKPEILEAERLLEALEIEGPVTFQVFDDKKDKDDKKNKKVYPEHKHGALNDLWPWLTKKSALGAGVFFMVNQVDGPGRTTEDVRKVRALFLDLDGAPLEPVLGFPIRPNVIVNSSPKKWHVYWLVEECVRPRNNSRARIRRGGLRTRRCST